MQESRTLCLFNKKNKTEIRREGAKKQDIKYKTPFGNA